MISKEKLQERITELETERFALFQKAQTDLNRYDGAIENAKHFLSIVEENEKREEVDG